MEGFRKNLCRGIGDLGKYLFYSMYFNYSKCDMRNCVVWLIKCLVILFLLMCFLDDDDGG